MTQIKAIETEYNGYRFRSRLEARWAVFFDAAGIRYEYEPEGFDMDGEYYLPDFWLPDIDDGIYVEVKGLMDESDYEKVDKFWHNGKHPLLVVGGLPTQSELERYDIYEYVGKYEHCFEIGGPFQDGGGGCWDWPYLFCVCPACGKVGVEFDGRGWRVCGNIHRNKNLDDNTYEDEHGNVHRFEYPECAGWRTDDKGYSWNNDKLAKAYDIARKARFEHGETPVVSNVRQ